MNYLYIKEERLDNLCINHALLDCELLNYVLQISQTPYQAWFNNYHIFLKLGFTPCKAEEPLQDMELQKNKHKKIKAWRKSLQKETTVNGCLLILNLKPFRS